VSLWIGGAEHGKRRSNLRKKVKNLSNPRFSEPLPPTLFEEPISSFFSATKLKSSLVHV
jgi:hypothetical protein